MSCRVLNNRLVHYFDKEGALHEGLAGFRVNRSCMDNVYNLNEIVEGRLKEDKETYTRFTESVDTVQRDGFMTYRCAVFLEGEKSAVFRLEQGVAQGCSLSPILVKCSALWASLSEPHRGTHSGCCHIIYATPTGYRKCFYALLFHRHLSTFHGTLCARAHWRSSVKLILVV